MKAFVTSLGESTTDLCIWSLQRQGFNVELKQNSSNLWTKLKQIFENLDEDILRVDADVIVNKNIKTFIKTDSDIFWWSQAIVYDWYKQDVSYGGIQFIRKECIPFINKHINEAERLDRPETYLTRLPELHNPRRFGSVDIICGLHGYKQSDVNRVKNIKMARQYYPDYDFELAEKLDLL